MDWLDIIALVCEIIIIPLILLVIALVNGLRCLLRNEMLHIYYRHQETKTMRQYEYENFIFLYKAYKALRGNSFIDKIYKEIETWKVVS